MGEQTRNCGATQVGCTGRYTFGGVLDMRLSIARLPIQSRANAPTGSRANSPTSSNAESTAWGWLLRWRVWLEMTASRTAWGGDGHHGADRDAQHSHSLGDWRSAPKDRVLAGMAALALATASLAGLAAQSSDGTKPTDVPAAQRATSNNNTPVTATQRREWAFGGYGGVAYTHPSTVAISGNGRTNMTIQDFGWIGKPFKAPVYYGARIQRWSQGRVGGMLDFTHAKAIADPTDTATLTGQHNGKDLPATATVRDVFRKLEFSHGHNMLTLNGLLRLTPSWMRLRPYVGLGGGISLPHTEIGFRADNVRTYEYQFAGLVGQALAGLEVQLGPVSVFVEYKLTHAPYDVPLSHRSPGWLLVTDVWQQFQDWLNNAEAPGGRLRVDLTTQHAVAGVLIKPNAPFGRAR